MYDLSSAYNIADDLQSDVEAGRLNQRNPETRDQIDELAGVLRQAQQPFVAAPLDWSQQDEVQLAKVRAGQAQVLNDLRTGDLHPEYAVPMLNDLNTDYTGLLGKKQQVAQMAQQQQKQQALDAAATAKAVEMQNGQADAQGFRDRMAVAFTADGQPVQFYQSEPGKWQQVQVESQPFDVAAGSGNPTVNDASTIQLPPSGEVSLEELQRIKAMQDTAEKGPTPQPVPAPNIGQTGPSWDLGPPTGELSTNETTILPSAEHDLNLYMSLRAARLHGIPEYTTAITGYTRDKKGGLHPQYSSVPNPEFVNFVKRDMQQQAGGAYEMGRDNIPAAFSPDQFAPQQSVSAGGDARPLKGMAATSAQRQAQAYADAGQKVPYDLFQRAALDREAQANGEPTSDDTARFIARAQRGAAAMGFVPGTPHYAQAVASMVHGMDTQWRQQKVQEQYNLRQAMRESEAQRKEQAALDKKLPPGSLGRIAYDNGVSVSELHSMIRSEVKDLETDPAWKDKTNTERLKEARRRVTETLNPSEPINWQGVGEKVGTALGAVLPKSVGSANPQGSGASSSPSNQSDQMKQFGEIMRQTFFGR